MDIKDYIIQESDKLFCQYGFKSVTMDDIARQLGMSKKTIYQHFSDKDELVNILIKEKLGRQECAMKDGQNHTENAVHELFFAIRNIHELLNNMNAKLFYDLQKYHPKAWLFFQQFKEQKLRQTISANLERGIAEGYYRTDMKTDILTQLRLSQVDLIFNQNDQYTMNKYSIAQVMAEITEHFLYGICNSSGLKMINKYKQKATSI
ncbi:Bacterial regulatory protein, tetR family [compost metagenome]